MLKRYWWLVGLLVAVLSLAAIGGIATERNRDENVKTNVVCVVSSKDARSGSRGGNIGYYANTMDCGHIKVATKSDYDKLLEGQAYFVDLHGDNKVQVEGRNWRVYDLTCFIDDSNDGKELYDKTQDSVE